MVKVDETAERILGSAGHSLNLKYGPKRDWNKKLKLILVEPLPECRTALRNNILERWPEAELSEHKHGWYRSRDGYVDLFESVTYFLEHKDPNSLGTSLFYFDPLRAPDLSLVDKIASTRIVKPYGIGTEFLIFFFTSDWVVGRPEFAALPSSTEEGWAPKQRESALAADREFGSRAWLSIVRSDHERAQMEDELVGLYKQSLRRWFRFVQPLPFVPKISQRYHLFCCSNYDTGMSVINSIYGKLTWPFGLQADNDAAYNKFLRMHRNLKQSAGRRARPAEWKVLWHIMKHHVDGVCDEQCKGDIRKKVSSSDHLKGVLYWLHSERYLKRIKARSWQWSESLKYPIYAIDWDVVKERLNVDPPEPPRALEPGDLNRPRIIEPEIEDEPTLLNYMDDGS